MFMFTFISQNVILGNEKTVHESVIQIYRRALRVPMTSADRLWQGYQKMEREYNNNEAEVSSGGPGSRPRRSSNLR